MPWWQITTSSRSAVQLAQGGGDLAHGQGARPVDAADAELPGLADIQQQGRLAAVVQTGGEVSAGDICFMGGARVRRRTVPARPRWPGLDAGLEQGLAAIIRGADPGDQHGAPWPGPRRPRRTGARPGSVAGAGPVRAASLGQGAGHDDDVEGTALDTPGQAVGDAHLDLAEPVRRQGARGPPRPARGRSPG